MQITKHMHFCSTEGDLLVGTIIDRFCYMLQIQLINIVYLLQYLGFDQFAKGEVFLEVFNKAV